MTALQSAVYAALAGHAGVGGLVGARVYPDVAPQGAAVPYVVWQEISNVQVNDLGGSYETSGKHQVRVQVTFWDRNGTKSREGGKQARLAMIAASGFKSTCVDQRALPYEEDTKLHGDQSDFSVWIST